MVSSFTDVLPEDGAVSTRADSTAHEPAAAQQAHGLLRLRFERAADSERMTLTFCEQRPPLKVVRAFEAGDGAALVHLHNLSGGVLGGDKLELSVEIGEGARAQLTTTGATRLYRSRREMPAAFQRQRFEVCEGALLEYLPDELIPFAGSRYRQATSIELCEGAGLFWWEVVAPGRTARGELFEYDSLQLSLNLNARGLPLAHERIALDPVRRPPQSPARLGPYLYFATFYVCQVGVSGPRWLQLEGELSELAQRLSRPTQTLWGVSALPAHGLIVKALSVRGRDITRGLHDFWRAAKRELYNLPAVPPRKVY